MRILFKDTKHESKDAKTKDTKTTSFTSSWCLYSQLGTYFSHSCGVSNVEFKLVNAGREVNLRFPSYNIIWLLFPISNFKCLQRKNCDMECQYIIRNEHFKVGLRHYVSWHFCQKMLFKKFVRSYQLAF